MFQRPSFLHAVFALVVAAFGCFAFIEGAQHVHQNWQFAGAVERTTATVTNRYISVTHGRGGHTSYYVTYSYRDMRGASFWGRRSVTEQTYNRLSESGPVPIKYLPDSHVTSHIDLPAEDWKNAWDAYVLATLGAGMGSLGGYVVITWTRRVFQASAHDHLPDSGQVSSISGTGSSDARSQARFRSTVTPTRGAGSGGNASGS